MKRCVLVLGLLVAPLGCSNGIDFESFCQDLAEQCRDDPDYVLRAQECTDEGLALERTAAEAECDLELDDHIACVEQAVCNWNHDCVTTRQRLDACIDEADR